MQVIYNVFTDEQVQALAESLSQKVLAKVAENQTADTLLTQAEACEYYHIDRVTLWRWVRDGVLVPKRIGRKKYYVKEQLAQISKQA